MNKPLLAPLAARLPTASTPSEPLAAPTTIVRRQAAPLSHLLAGEATIRVRADAPHRHEPQQGGCAGRSCGAVAARVIVHIGNDGAQRPVVEACR